MLVNSKIQGIMRFFSKESTTPWDIGQNVKKVTFLSKWQYWVFNQVLQKDEGEKEKSWGFF